MKKKVLMSIAVLSATAVVCTILLAVFNKIWFISEDEKFNRSVSSIMQAEEFEILYDADNADNNPSGNYDKIKAFNDGIGANANYGLKKVRLARGGRDDGYYLFQSRGRGFGGGFVEVLIGYTPEGRLTGIVKLDMSKSNDRAGDVNWEAVSGNVKDKTYEDEFAAGKTGGAELAANTGATVVVTLGGASEAIKIANKFFKDYIMGTGQPEFEIVTDAAKKVQLHGLFMVENSYYKDKVVSQYIKYPVTTEWESGFGGQARVSAVYYGDGKYLIAEVESQRGRYGDWTILVLLNNETNLVAAINPIASSYSEGRGYDASKLFDAKNLTELYRDVELSAIAGMMDEETLLQGTTKPTQTIDGLKACIAHVLKNAGKLRTDLAALAGGQTEGV